jgi:hypothetical protein
MKRFDVFEHETEGREAVKDGFSWPAFFFKWIWAFVKGLPGRGLMFLVAVGVAAFLDSALGGHRVPFLTELGFSLWVGFEGNEWRRKALYAKGYRWVGTVEAESPGEALESSSDRQLPGDSEVLSGPMNEPNTT